MSNVSVVMVDPLNYTPYYDLNLCAALVREGWNVELLTSPYMFETIEPPPNVAVKKFFIRFADALIQKAKLIRESAVMRSGIKAISYPFGLMRLDRELASRRAGILHVQWALLPPIDAVFWERWKSRGWKIVYTAHDVDGLDGTTPRLLSGTNARLFRIADAVIAHSERDCIEIIRRGANPSRTNRVPQGTPGLFASNRVNREDARRQLGIDAARPTILSFGLLKPYKGLETLLHAMVEIREQNPDVLLLIAGQSLANHEKHLRLIDELGLSHVVRWDRSYVPTARVGLYFAAADVVALPYKAASSSAVLLNAYAHGVPVVATTVGGFPETVLHGRTGLLVPPEAPRELAMALGSLLKNPQVAREMGKCAREYAATHHEWESIGRVTTDVYNSVTLAKGVE